MGQKKRYSEDVKFEKEKQWFFLMGLVGYLRQSKKAGYYSIDSLIFAVEKDLKRLGKPKM